MRQACFWPYMHPDSKRNWRTQHHLAVIDMKCPIMPLAFSRALASFLPWLGLVCLFFHPSGDDDPNWLSSASVWVWLPLWNHTNPYSNLCQCLQTACHLPINTLSPWADSRVQLPHAAIVLHSFAHGDCDQICPCIVGLQCSSGICSARAMGRFFGRSVGARKCWTD